MLAASSLERVLTAWAPEIEVKLGVRLAMSFAASSVIARQVVEGAPADVLITADRRSMEVAAAAGVVGRRTIVARNRLALVVRRTNPARISSVRDLARRDIKVVLCDPDVPCGRLASALLEKLGLRVHPHSLEENVSAAVGKVALGEADAAIAYQSDVTGSRRDIDGVPVPEAADPEFEAVYPAAVVQHSGQRAAAGALIEFLVSPAAQKVLARAGFVQP